VANRSPAVAGMCLALAGSLLFAPIADAGGSFHGTMGGHSVVGGGHGFTGRPFVSHPGSGFVPRPFSHPGSFIHPRPFIHPSPFVHHRPFFHHHRFFHGFGAFGGIASSIVYVAPPWPCYDSYGYPCNSYGYYPPPVAYGSIASPGPPAVSTVSLAPAPPPAPTQPPAPDVVEFPSGRYELRGDGMTVPYKWVWIPNPPSAPPGTASDVSRHHELYRWTDKEGVLHATDRLEVVPPEYRSQAKQAPPL
jgi:hypothetical protein